MGDHVSEKASSLHQSPKSSMKRKYQKIENYATNIFKEGATQIDEHLQRRCHSDSSITHPFMDNEFVQKGKLQIVERPNWVSNVRPS